MSANNGVIRIGRKGLKKFAFGEDGEPFEVDVVVAFQEWIGIDEGMRDNEERVIKTVDMPAYHEAAVRFAQRMSGGNTDSDGNITITVSEALEFIALLREEYDRLASFFQPKSPEKRDSHASMGSELRFSVEDSSLPSTS